MKLSNILLVMLGGMISLSVFALDEDELNLVSFKNGTGSEITYLYLSPEDSSYWGADLLGADRVLDNGDSLGFFIHYPDRCNEFDVMAEDDQENTFVLFGYEICDGTEEVFEFVRKDLNDEVVVTSLIEIGIRNDTPFDMMYVFISPADSRMWGADLLDENTILESGEELYFLFPDMDETVDYDFAALDEDGDIYEFSLSIGSSHDGDVVPIEMSDLQ